MSLAHPVLNYTCRQYGDHSLQKIGIWQFAGKAHKPADGRWIVFIHGGAWRDPKITHLSFSPAINHLVSSARASCDSISGFASIDYRLSPHPDHPQDPADTPASALRAARHPDHVHDVQSALRLLRDEYGLSDSYVLIGHSAGATLAYQLLMDQAPQDIEAGVSSVPLPAAIIGISGIYDLVGIDSRHDGQYAGFITGAFGSEREAWRAASPAKYTGSFKKNWPSANCTVLAWSRQDTLIDEPEIDGMAAKLIEDRVNVSVTKDVTGDHDQVWQDGSQLARLALATLARLHESL